MPVSLNGSRRVCDTASIDEGESCTDYSLLDVYANREEYESSQDVINMNFVQFATKYKVVQSINKIAREYYITNISNLFS